MFNMLKKYNCLLHINNVVVEVGVDKFVCAECDIQGIQVKV